MTDKLIDGVEFFTDCVSDEPLSVIIYNEAHTDKSSLCTQRIRRLVNEIYNARSTLTPPSIAKWNDISGNGNHATQEIPERQPSIETPPDTQGALDLPPCTSFCQNSDNSNGICRACFEREKTTLGILQNIAKRMTADSCIDYHKWLFILIEEAIKTALTRPSREAKLIDALRRAIDALACAEFVYMKYAPNDSWKSGWTKDFEVAVEVYKSAISEAEGEL